MKAYKLEVLVIDHEGYGPTAIAAEVENCRHLTLSVINSQAAEIGEWTDEHPLNYGDKQRAECERLFPQVQSPAVVEVPAGYAVVPLKPTPAMVRAWRSCAVNASFNEAAWKAAIAAVPTQQGAEPSDAVAMAVRIMAAVDEFHERPTSSHRTTLRTVILEELKRAAMQSNKGASHAE